jgi:DNA-binding beta-propeller fold protein YncE
VRRIICWTALPALLCLLAAAAPVPPAHAGRPLLLEAALDTDSCARCPESFEGTEPPPEGQIEGACGLAISPAGHVYVADYHHRRVDLFGLPTATARGGYQSQILLPGVNPVFGINTLDSVCGLALDAAGNLYGNEWHEGVLRLTGGEATIDSGESTGLAIDPASDRLYVNDRTYIAEYALPYVEGAGPVATIGAGALGEGFGLAVADGRVYAADAGDQTVKVFEPAISETTPTAIISDRFNSLTDASLAIDPTNDHLLVVDNLQPGFEHPSSSVLEFGAAAAGYPFLGRLPGAPIHGAPSGIAVDASGRAIVTDGNGELSNAFLYGAYEGAASLSMPTASSATSGFAAAGAVTGAAGGGYVAPFLFRPRRSASTSEVSQNGGVRVSFQGNLMPRALPRRGTSPVVASVGARVVPLDGRTPPQLRRIEISINRNGRFAPASVPACRLEQIQPATTGAALAACRRALVGEGSFSARVLLPEQAPFPSSGKVYAFNGRWHGHPAIFAHVYGTKPVPVSYTIPFLLLSQNGTYGTLLRASLPEVTGNSGYITALSLTFGRGPRARGYISAGCPAPAGLDIAPFPFARVAFSFAGDRTVDSTLTRTCRTIHAG